MRGWTAAVREVRGTRGRWVRRAALPVAAVLAATLLPQLEVVPARAADSGGNVVRSPSGQLGAVVARNDLDGTVDLRIDNRGAPIQSSRLGLTTDEADLTQGLRLVASHERRVEENYETAVGKRRQHRDAANELALEFENPAGQRLGVQVRVFDDGVGYRYTVPGGGPTRVLSEATTFELPGGAQMWAAEHRPNYENLHNAIDVRDVEDAPYQYPSLFRLPHGSWALVTESDLDGRYVASHLRPTGEPGGFRLEFAEGGVTSELPLSTPWRVTAVGELADIVETDLITDLASEQRFPVPDWVRPGTVAWSWWSDGDSPRDVERQREYVDHAAEEGWEYVLVDEGWDPAWVPGLVEYARQRGVGVLLWSRWTDLDTDEKRDMLLAQWKSWGVAGIKVDFMDSDSQARMRWYDDILAATAEHELAINLHGSTIPRGIERTWPHVMTMEGVRGAEDYHFGYLTPENNVTLPFTRNVVGSMDYTPTTLSAERRETSAGHELALAVAYESGWQHPADSVETYDSRGIVESVLRELPTAWDDTEFLGGEPGESATIARRLGEEWFVGAIRAGAPADIRVPLDFLDGHREYVAEVVRDSGHDGLEVERRAVTAGQEINVPAERHGGAVVLLCPAEQGGCLDESLHSRVSVDTDDAFLAPGSSHTVRVTVGNDAPEAMEQVTASLAVPQGWQSEPSGPPVPERLPPGAEATASWTVRVPADAEAGSAQELRAQLDHRAGEAEVGRTGTRQVHVRPQEPPAVPAYLSDLPAFDSFNWTGPVERDMSNGGEEEGDGGPITIDGQVFAKGLGGQAHSEQVYYLGGRCGRFQATVGVDDSMADRGSVVFQVWGDDRLLHDSGPLTGDSAAAPLDVDVSGVESLRIVLADGGDFVSDDLGDWGGAHVACG